MYGSFTVLFGDKWPHWPQGKWLGKYSGAFGVSFEGVGIPDSDYLKNAAPVPSNRFSDLEVLLGEVDLKILQTANLKLIHFAGSMTTWKT